VLDEVYESLFQIFKLFAAEPIRLFGAERGRLPAAAWRSRSLTSGEKCGVVGVNFDGSGDG
jgi:hypothetical protein